MTRIDLTNSLGREDSQSFRNGRHDAVGDEWSKQLEGNQQDAQQIVVTGRRLGRLVICC